MSTKRSYESHDNSDDEMSLALNITQQMDDDAVSVALCLQFTMELHAIAAESETKSYRYVRHRQSTCVECPHFSSCADGSRVRGGPC